MRWLYITAAVVGFFLGRALFAQDSVASNIPAGNIPAATYLPKWYGSAGGGALAPGSAKFAYQAVAVFVGQASYLTAVTEYSFSKKTGAQTCTLGGLSKVLYEFAALSIGTTGLGGGCTTTSDSGGAAAAVQGFVSFRIRKTGFSILGTGEKGFTIDGRQGAKLTLGVSYGK